jgi:D-alanyl-D-alanine carboxypeptidase
MKKGIVFVAMLVVMLSRIGIAHGETVPPTIYSGTGVVMDSSTGEILYQKNKDEQAYPASLTKLMTAILLEEHAADGEWMTASKKATYQEASNFVFNLKVGEKMQKEEALKALLVISANDVAMMIAEHIGGDEAGFAAMMNEKAKSIGMVHTHFVTPNGLHDPQHYTTAYDFALLAKEAMKYPAIMEAMGTEQTVVKTDQRQVKIKNNSFIFQNPLAIGGKNGFTNQAHNTLIEYMRKDNKTVIAVVMKSTRNKEYQDVQTIGNYGLEQIDVARVFQKGEAAGETTFHGADVQGILGDSFVVTKPKSSAAVFTYTPVFATWPDGPKTIKAGDVIGSFQIMEDGKLLKQIPIVSAKDVSLPILVANRKTDSAPKWPLWLAGGLLLIAYGSFRIVKKRRQRKLARTFPHKDYGA